MENNVTITGNRAKASGLTGFQLKYLALVLMLLDHVEYFFTYTGRIPLWFSWLGRLAAPLFLFCVVEGFIHTHDRKTYILRIYLLSALMGLIQFSFYNVASGLVRDDGFIPQNAMLSSLFILLVVLQGLDWCKEGNYGRGIAAIVIPVCLPYVFSLFLYQPMISAQKTTALFVLNAVNMSILPLHTMIADGGTMTLIQGVVLYLFRKKRKEQAVAFVVTTLLIDLGKLVLFVPGVTLHELFFFYYEWMEVFAVAFFLLYNGKKGNGNKYLFYWFYPLHIYILYAVTVFIYH